VELQEPYPEIYLQVNLLRVWGVSAWSDFEGSE
jgi:hypothetical protein